MAEVYVGLGTNLGDKEQNLRDAVQKIEEQIGKVVSLSAFYVTAPWGFASENSFLNAAACVDTDLSPLEVLRETQLIERELGRTESPPPSNDGARFCDAATGGDCAGRGTPGIGKDDKRAHFFFLSAINRGR